MYVGGVVCESMRIRERAHVWSDQDVQTIREHVACAYIYACGETGDMMGPRALNLKSNTTACGLYDAALYAVGSSTQNLHILKAK